MRNPTFSATLSAVSGGACPPCLRWATAISIPLLPSDGLWQSALPIWGVGAVAIPTGIISAGFVEQYQRKSSLSNIREADIHEIAEIFVDKRYAGKTIEETEKAEGVTIFLILREDLSILPQKDTLLKLNDIIVIRADGK